MTGDDHIPFNRPYLTGEEQRFIADAASAGHLSAGGTYTQRCEAALEHRLGASRVLLMPSGTAALEAAALLSGVEAGDEVIMPSFTFASTANAFALRGAVPVFVDVRRDTLNIDEALVEAALTTRTRAIVPVHYAGVGCEMAAISAVAARHGLIVVEDAAHAVMANYQGRPLGTFGELGALSFHETKNLTCGEGGALIINDRALIERAEMIRDKGTDRAAFARGDIAYYSWVGVGSSFGLSDLNAAFLWAQIRAADAITCARLEVWNRYHGAFAEIEDRGLARRPVVPPSCRHNGNMYYLLLEDRGKRDALIALLGERGINAVFHYVPLHSSQAGRAFGRASGDLPVTDAASERIVRLPIWAGMTADTADRVIAGVTEVLTTIRRGSGRLPVSRSLPA